MSTVYRVRVEPFAGDPYYQTADTDAVKRLVADYDRIGHISREVVEDGWTQRVYAVVSQDGEYAGQLRWFAHDTYMDYLRGDQ